MARLIGDINSEKQRFIVSWEDDVLSLSKWALKSQDLRHQYLYAESPDQVSMTPGLAWCLEAVVVLAIYEAAIGKGYRRRDTIDYERAYPGYDGQNPPRADLAFKKTGVGKNWAYLEIKCYGSNGKSFIDSDIEKLKSIEQKAQRWILIYRIRPAEGKSKSLPDLLQKNFGSRLAIHGIEEFKTVASTWEPGICEICLARVR